MKNILSLALPLCFGLSLILGSCAKYNSVVSSHRVQKRKYNKGYHIALNKKKKSSQENTQKETIISQADTYQTIVKTEKTLAVDKKVNLMHTEKEQQSFRANEGLALQPQTVDKKKTNTRKSFVKRQESSKAYTYLGVKNSEEKISNNQSSIKKLVKSSIKESKSSDLEPIIYILLCIFIPFVAVGLATDWEVRDVVINLLLCCLCGIPGIIHAFIVCNREGVI